MTMKRNRSTRGSALLVSVIFVVAVVTLGGALLTESVFRGRTQFRTVESDEALMICDAALERARVALLAARNEDPDAWNLILERCEAEGASWTPGAIQADYLVRRGSSEFVTHDPVRDARVPELGGRGESMLAPLFSGSGSTPAVFLKNVPFGKGGYFMTVRDNPDIHGDGVDNNNDGDRWDPDTQTERAAGLTSPLIDGDRQVYVLVTATLADGTQRQVDSLLLFPGFRWMPPAALLTGGTLSLQGSFSVKGTLGVIHSNEDIVGNGSANAFVSQSINATGSARSYTMGTPPVGGINDSTSNPPVAAVPIPVIDPTEYRYDPTLMSNMIVLASNGKITDASGVPLPAADDLPFAYAAGAWSVKGANTVRPAIYYVEGDFKLAGAGNSDAYEMTIIATGSVTFGGNSKVYAFTDPATGLSTNTLAIAGGDLSLTGTASASTVQYKGASFAHEQVYIKGNYQMEGAVIGENAVDQCSVVSTSNSVEDSLVGNATITYNGTTTFLRNPQSAVSVVCSRRVK
jgi:hypothetical protein